MPPNTRTLKGQSYSTKRWANLAWPKGSKLSGFSNNDGEMMVYIDSTGIVTKIFSSADEIISISLKDNQIMITAIYYDLIVTISVLSF